MQTGIRKKIMKRAYVVLLLLALGVNRLTGQTYMPASPVPSNLGFSPAGSLPQDRMESINPVAGNVNLAIPLAALPPGAGGLTAGVRLIYNSAFYGLSVSTASGGLQETYSNNLTTDPNEGSYGSDGGWTYGSATLFGKRQRRMAVALRCTSKQPMEPTICSYWWRRSPRTALIHPPRPSTLDIPASRSTTLTIAALVHTAMSSENSFT